MSYRARHKAKMARAVTIDELSCPSKGEKSWGGNDRRAIVPTQQEKEVKR
ncbi:hypothetical protein [Bacillus marasmi]|nr:hypothetical protein [Bacillus marasmi]